MLENKKQYLNSLKLYKEFKEALDCRQLNPDANPFKQKLHLDSIMYQLESFKEELNDYEQRSIRFKK